MKKKIISWSLVLMLLLNLVFPNVNILAEEGTMTEAGQTEQAETTENLMPQAASPTTIQLVRQQPQANDVLGKLKDMEETLLQDGSLILPGGTLDPKKPFEIKVSFGVPVEGDLGATPETSVHQGDKATITLGKGFQIKGEVTCKLESQDSKKIGTVVLKQVGEEIIADISFDGEESIYDGQSQNVTAEFRAAFEAASSGSGQTGGELGIVILGKDYHLQLPKKIEYVMTKTGQADLANKVVNWTITVEAREKEHPENQKDLAGYTLVDDLTKAGPYKADSLTVGGNAAVPTEVTANELKYTFPANSVSPQVITLQTTLTDKEANPQKPNAPTIKFNKAALYLNMQEDAKAEAAYEVKELGKQWIAKEGGHPSIEADGSYSFEWIITVNQEKESLPSAVVTDQLQEGMTFLNAKMVKKAEPNVIVKEWTQKPADDKYELGDIEDEMRLIIRVKAERRHQEIARTFKNTAEITWANNPYPFPAKADFKFDFFDLFNRSFEKNVEGEKTSSDPQRGRNWENAAIRWKIRVSKAVFTELNDPRVFELMIYDKKEVPGLGQNVSPIKDLELNADSRAALGLQSDAAMKAFMTDLLPVYGSYQKYMNQADSFQPLSGLTKDNIKVHPVFKGNVQVGDLVEISGGDTTVDWEFILEGTVTDWYYMYRQPKPESVDNTAHLFNGTVLKDRDRFRMKAYKLRLLDKELLAEDKAEEFRKAPTAELANNAKTTEADKGYHYADNTVIYRISVNGDNHQYLDLTMGKLVLKDVLPQGWEFVKINEDADYLIFNGQTIGHDTDDTSVMAEGEAINGQQGTAVAGLGWTADEFIGKGEVNIQMNQISRPYVVFLAARPTEAKLKEYLTGKEAPVAKNTVIFKGDKVANDLFREQKVEFDVRLLNKDVITLGGVLEWTIQYNLKNFPVPVEKAVLEDTLSEGMNLRMKADGSLDLENAFFLNEVTAGTEKRIPLTEGQDITYDAGTRTLTLNLPDKQKTYRFTYLTDVTGTEGTKLNNKVKLKGMDGNSQTTEKEYKIQAIDGGGSYKANALIEIRKVDEAGNPLAGAEFQLTAAGTAPQTLTTGATGFLRFNHLLDEIGTRTYTLKETKAPEGYLLDETEHTVAVERESATKVKVLIDGIETREIRVVNQRKPVDPGNDTPLKPYDPDNGDDTPPVTPPTPPVTPVTPPADIDENPIPEGNTTVPQESVTVPEVPFTDEIPEGVPELPKTGGIPGEAFSFFGMALAALGLLFKRSK